jgi:hypothetical protein
MRKTFLGRTGSLRDLPKFLCSDHSRDDARLPASGEPPMPSVTRICGFCPYGVPTNTMPRWINGTINLAERLTTLCPSSSRKSLHANWCEPSLWPLLPRAPGNYSSLLRIIARAHDIQGRLSQNTKLTVHDGANRSAPRLGSRFAVGTGHIKFWLMHF